MLEQLSAVTQKAKPNTAKRIGSIVGAHALGACDIGECELESGEVVTITWGRNLNKASQERFAERTDCDPVWISADSGAAELILPPAIAEVYRSMIDASDRRWSVE